MDQQEVVLVSAPNAAGEAFVKLLLEKDIPFAALANNRSELKRMRALGARHLILLHTSDEKTWVIPQLAVGKIFLFERSLNLCCRYLQICRSWTSKPIYVITANQNPRLIYRGLGANYVIYTSSRNYSFLVTDEPAAYS
ncbi:MAG: hypothetical protein E6230_16525 [Paenibacillus dendritiformis]|uniref:hypothetical protein n=1 Tax=Paenibacillus dendritiformis TaxID=130049 RepID=UPI00143D8702|nr:hypothetical protein [Paenibacillus dendritiformis]MDU5143778.1 hypothetical protein [Paenibacillus dendritiformis]NKI20223.1 hypothetical protein [Paenibacillus dendritiformis]NRF99657.1 hypothetical protein [Paenibacillus dendritiformis]GIO75612.1 hypothetical protein J27TS7_51260 [Paenibacillus dendritiformis]